MPFLAYVAIILVSLGGILFEVNWLTSPKLETKPAVQASTAAPPKVAEAPIAPRSEAAPPRNVAPTVTMVPAASTTTPPPPPAIQAQASGPAPAGPAPQAAAPSASVAVSAPAISPAPFTPAQTTTGVASTDFNREFTTDAKPAATVSAATVTPAVAVATNNKCDVAACSAAYQSFRASDCTFQPMEGARKVCDRAPETAQRAPAPARDARVDTAGRRPGRDAELRAVERVVRRITVEEADLDPDLGRSEVMVIERRAW